MTTILPCLLAQSRYLTVLPRQINTLTLDLSPCSSSYQVLIVFEVASQIFLIANDTYTLDAGQYLVVVQQVDDDITVRVYTLRPLGSDTSEGGDNSIGSTVCGLFAFGCVIECIQGKIPNCRYL